MLNKYTIFGFIFALVVLGLYQSGVQTQDLMKNIESIPALATAKTRGGTPAETISFNEQEIVKPTSPVTPRVASSGNTGTSLLDELIITQRQLDEQTKLIKELMSRVARLESAQTVSSQASLKSVASLNKVPNTVQPNKASAETQRLSDIELIEQQTMKTFEDLVKQVSEENIDKAWAKEMESYIQQAQKKLQSNQSNPVKIISQECRSESCVVEFAHQGAIDEEQVIGFLAEKRIRRVVTQHTERKGGNKTVAIYQR